jgi:hypothetical protein
MLVYGFWLLQFAQDGGLGLEILNLTLTHQDKEEAGNCSVQWSANGSVGYMLGAFPCCKGISSVVKVWKYSI